MFNLDLNRLEQLKASGDLPSPKGVALAIMRMTQKEDVSVIELARIIKTDPAFVGRLIKAANCLIGQTRRPIASVQDALTVLGLAAVRNMALGFSLLSNYRNGSCERFDYAAFWSGSIACAVAMQSITQKTRIAAPDETYCLGLLSRVGELALTALYPQDYSNVLELAATGEEHITALEDRAFAMNHIELGAALLGDWGIPKVFIDPLVQSQQPHGIESLAESREYKLAHSLRLARQLAGVCIAPSEERLKWMPQLLSSWECLALERSELIPLCDGVAREWGEWGNLLNLTTDELPSFETMMESASLAGNSPEHASNPAPVVPIVKSAPTRPAPAREAVMRVLLVDSDPVTRTDLEVLLKGSGYEVLCAEDGPGGMDMALEMQPHIMIVDWNLPSMSGIELTQVLRQTRVGRGIYILLLTTQENEDRLVEAFTSGVDDFMSKPVNARVLAARLSAGNRMIVLHEEIKRDREEVRHYAAELAVTNRRLQEVALTDSLTEIPNRRYFMERLEQAWAITTRNKGTLSCLIVDFDDFKQINDTHGHDVGDRVLRETAMAIKKSLRTHDVVARTGGDEFLILCPDSALEAALICGKRVCRAVESMEIHVGTLTLKVTISIGAAQREASMKDSDMLIKCADKGLYLAKQAGGNTIACAQTELITHAA